MKILSTDQSVVFLIRCYTGVHDGGWSEPHRGFSSSQVYGLLVVVRRHRYVSLPDGAWSRLVVMQPALTIASFV